MGRPNILYTAFVAQDYMTTPVAKMGASVKGLAATTSVASAKMAASLSKVSSAAMGIGFAGIAIATGIIIPLGLATKAAINFEAQMANVSTLVDTTVENMDEMGESVLRLSKKIPKPINDLTEGLYYIRSAGIGAADAMGVLEASGKLAVAGLSTTTEAAKAVTSAMVSFKAQGLSATQIANSFFLTVREGKTKMADLNESFGATALVVASAGVKLEEFNGAVAALTNTGMEASLAQIGVKNTIIGLIRPTTQMSQVFRALNVQTGEQLIAMLGYGGALDAVAAKAKSLNIEQAKLFNRTALTADIGLTEQARDQRIKNTEEQIKAQDALSGATAKQMATADAQMKIFKNTTQILGITIGHILIPPLTKMVNIISPIIDGIVSFSHHHKLLTSAIVDSVAVIGLFAGTVGVASLAVAGITRGLKGLIIINGLFGASEVAAAAETDVLTASIVVQTGATARLLAGIAGFSAKSALFLGRFGMAAKSAFAELAIGYGIYKMIQGEMAKNKAEKERNPLGFDFSEDANSKKNKNIRDYYNISEDEFNKDKTYAGFKDAQLTAKPGAYKNMFGFAMQNPFVNPNSTGAGSSTVSNNATEEEAQAYKDFQQRRDSDSSFAKSDQSARYAPGFAGTHEVKVVVVDKTRGGIEATPDNAGGAAKGVPVKWKSTTAKP